MDESMWTIIDIVGPVILLIVLVWLVLRNRSNRSSDRTESGTRDVYAEEEARRREGTDDL